MVAIPARAHPAMIPMCHMAFDFMRWLFFTFTDSPEALIPARAHDALQNRP